MAPGKAPRPPSPLSVGSGRGSLHSEVALSSAREDSVFRASSIYPYRWTGKAKRRVAAGAGTGARDDDDDPAGNRDDRVTIAG